MTSFVSHLEGAIDGTRLPFDGQRVHTMYAGRPLWVRYDLAKIAARMSRAELAARPPTMWRYAELLPTGTEGPRFSLAEGTTPLVECHRLGQEFGLNRLWIKDESQLPTGSFKSRGLAMAINMAAQLGIRRVAIPSAGNAGGAAAAYAARAGMEAFVFMPDDTPRVNQYEAALAGAKVFLVDGLISDCGRIVREGREAMGWFDLSTLKEPYRLEGKKTMGLELAEQCQWRLPDVVLYPTGGGTGLIGMWKAFRELVALGWLESEVLPRMVAVQSDGCCPIVRAFQAGQRFADEFPGASTMAAGIRVPSAVGDFMILDAVRESRGLAVAVAEDAIRPAMRMAASVEGIAVCPEAAACLVAARELSARSWIQPGEHVVVFNTAAAQKYVEVMATDLPRIDAGRSIDWERFSVDGPK